MSRNYVSKVFVGTALANTNLAQVDPEALTEGQIIVFDEDTGVEVDSDTKRINFARGTAKLGEPLFSGAMKIADLQEAFLNPYKAPVNQKSTLTVDAVPTVGKAAIFKVTYHDNLSIIPNQMKQTIVSLVADADNAASTTTWAAAIAAEFNKQDFLFVGVTAATNVVTFESVVLSTESSYNGIDRPETVTFEVNCPADGEGKGNYTVAKTQASSTGQGTPSKVAWMEDQAQGRLGFSDRRMWNNTKKFVPTAKAGETYAVLNISGNKVVEGDMQGLRHNPIGVFICGDSGTVADILTDLARAGVVPTTIAAG